MANQKNVTSRNNRRLNTKAPIRRACQNATRGVVRRARKGDFSGSIRVAR